ncbi:MAG: DNA repair protein RecO, partial [Chloroflexota bacterium]
MRAARTYQTRAIILRQFHFAEVDKLLTLFTRDQGKLKAIAKGASRPGSKLGGHVEPLTLSSLMLARGRNLHIVTQGQIVESYSQLKNDLERSACGQYILELVDLFTAEGNEDSALFDLLLETLGQLGGCRNTSALLHYFELQLLGHVGYRPRLQRCTGCGAALQPEINYFSFEHGGVVCPDCARGENDTFALSVDALKVLRMWQTCDH